MGTEMLLEAITETGMGMAMNQTVMTTTTVCCGPEGTALTIPVEASTDRTMQVCYH